MGFFTNIKARLGLGSSLHDRGGVRISSYLNPKRVAIFSHGPSKQQVFGSLLGLLDLPDPSAALKALLAREEVGSTVIGPGIAVPHARLSGLPKLQAALGVCPAGVVDAHAAGGPVHLFLLFLGPAENMREHLAFLAGAAAILQTDGVVQRLVKLDQPAAILKEIQKIESRL